ncbi:MAG: exosortase/archaeosortase family protein [Ferruginibacter sp.]
MNINPVGKSPFLIYLIKFIGIFSILFYGTIGFIGLTAPGGYYSPLFDHYLNYVSWLRSSLLYGAKFVVSIAGFDTQVKNIYTLAVPDGRGVHVGYDCLGYGVLSFWVAFIIANSGERIKKIKWLAGGMVAIWCINVLRIAILLIAINQQWHAAFGFDHHTWFNIAAYTFIFTGIYFYDKSIKRPTKMPDARP